jgi:dihydrofolate reductase
MNPSQLSAVVAVARNGTIGLNNSLPWKLRSDLQRFKKLTMGHALVMGRKTFESIGKPLPGRQTIVLTRQKMDFGPGVSVTESLECAIALVEAGRTPFIVGGAQIYDVAWPMITDLYLTTVLADVPGDAFLSAMDLTSFRCVERSFVPADTFNDWPSEYSRYVHAV